MLLLIIWAAVFFLLGLFIGVTLTCTVQIGRVNKRRQEKRHNRS